MELDRWEAFPVGLREKRWTLGRITCNDHSTYILFSSFILQMI